MFAERAGTLADVSGESGHGITRLLRAEMAVPLVFNGFKPTAFLTAV